MGIWSKIKKAVSGVVSAITAPFKKKEPKVKQKGVPIFKSTEKRAAESFRERTGRAPTILEVPEPTGKVGRTPEERAELGKTPEGRRIIMEEATEERLARSFELKEEGRIFDPEVRLLSAETIKKTLLAGGLAFAPFLGTGSKESIGIFKVVKKTKTFKAAFKIAATLSGIDVLTLWFGADNRASSSSYYTNLVWNRFNDGEVTRDEALERLTELETTHQEAKDFIDLSTSFNPVLWAFRNFYMQGMEEQEVNMAENRRLVTETIEPKAEFFERLEEEEKQQFDVTQELILEAQLKSEKRFAEAQEERDTKKTAWAKEQAQFYEALRKRNAGIPLTEAEIQLLLSWGIMPTTSMARWDDYGISSLSFGLL